MSSDNRDPKQEATVAAQWVAEWRKLEMEALGIADAQTDGEAGRHMLYIAAHQHPSFFRSSQA
jgi:hypothetical protein